jgi:NADPH2:quinone reductase
MRAVLVDPSAPGHLRLQEAPEPAPLPSQALVQVEAISLNLGEVRRARRSDPGSLLGWDLAGTVVAPAANGSGPQVGTRVVGIVPAGAWAERAAVETACMAPLPDNVSSAIAATLPVAGLTALYALEQGGHLLGRNVLVTGASGGVGYFGVQLAKLVGAQVAALIRQEKYTDLLRGIGVDWVVVGERATGAAAHAPYHCILESVGGQVLADSLQLVASDGILVSYGVSAGEQATIEVGQFFRTGRTRYYGLYLFMEFGRRPGGDGLQVLVDLVARGRLQAHIGAEGRLNELGDLAERLFTRQIAGKAVIHIA